MTEDTRVTAALEWTVGDTSTADIIEGLIAAYEERLRVNVGLVAENATLRRQIREHTCADREDVEEQLAASRRLIRRVAFAPDLETQRQVALEIAHYADTGQRL